MKPVFDDIFTFDGLIMGRVYAIKGADGLTLIDSGLARVTNRILRQIEAAGYASSDVKRILVTHTHIDHAGGLHAIQQATGAEIWVSAQEADTVRGTAELPRPTHKRFNPSPRQFFKPSQVHRELCGGDIVPDILGGLTAIATPGHTYGHLSFWSASRKILFTGDVLLHTLGISYPLPFVSADMALNRESARAVVALEPDALLFGHGPAITSGAAERLHDFARRRKL